MPGFTKLFGSIIHSTVWQEPAATRLVWITMLAMSDRKGYVGASVPGLADAAKVTVKECVTALDKFKSPDEFSRSQANEGRRVEDAHRGWLILNYIAFRNLASEEEERERKRIWAQESRAAKRSEKVAESSEPVAGGSDSVANSSFTTESREQRAEDRGHEGEKTFRGGKPVRGIVEVIDHLNRLVDGKYDRTTNHPTLRARLKGGATIEDCCLVLDHLYSRIWWREKGLVTDDAPFRLKSWAGKLIEAKRWNLQGRPSDPTGGPPRAGSRLGMHEAVEPRAVSPDEAEAEGNRQLALRIKRSHEMPDEHDRQLLTEGGHGESFETCDHEQCQKARKLLGSSVRPLAIGAGTTEGK